MDHQIRFHLWIKGSNRPEADGWSGEVNPSPFRPLDRAGKPVET